MEEIFSTTIESKEKPNINYTAFFVRDISQLVKQFSPRHKKVYGHHSTIAYKPPTLDGIDIGNETTLKVIGRVTDEKGDALLVESSRSNNKNTHITLSCAEGTDPFYSNEMIENAVATGQVTYFESPITINVVEGYFDGQKDVVKRD